MLAGAQCEMPCTCMVCLSFPAAAFLAATTTDMDSLAATGPSTQTRTGG